MNVGMLWFDNDPKTDLATKIARAATYYLNKYGQQPTVCFVHPSMVKNNPPKSNGITVKPSRSVMPHHLWLGLNGNGASSG